MKDMQRQKFCKPAWKNIPWPIRVRVNGRRSIAGCRQKKPSKKAGDEVNRLSAGKEHILIPYRLAWKAYTGPCINRKTC
jgi:hypothetical protein